MTRGVAKRLGVKGRESLLLSPISLLRLMGYPAPKPSFHCVRASVLSVEREVISTGVSALDSILGGGVETGAVTEFVGPPGCGKTQLCHQLAVMVQLPPSRGGLGAPALYVDTEGTFRPERLALIADYRGLDPDKALEGVIYARAYSSDHQAMIIGKVGGVIEEYGVGLLVVDSLVGHFRSEMYGNWRRALAKLYRHVSLLSRLAEDYGLAVVITNQVTEPPGKRKREFGERLVVATHKIWLEKVGYSRFMARVLSSPCLPPREAMFRITEVGVVGLEEPV